MSDGDTVELGWKGERAARVDGSSGGNPGELAVESDTIEGLVREALQNANDEGPIGDGPVKVVFRLTVYEGDELEDLVDALDLSTDPTEESLEMHLRQAAAEDRSLAAFVEHLEDADRLVVLTIEDYNTRGLVGAEETGDDGNNYRKLTLSELDTDKDASESRGGSWGVGKFVYPAWSGLSTVLFASRLSRPDPRDENPRLLGRAYLPSHDPPGNDPDFSYAGDVFFGRLADTTDVRVNGTDDDVVYKWGDGRGRPLSVWGEDVTGRLSAAGLPWDRDRSGTSISLLGFSKPGTGEQPSDLEEVGEKIARATSRWFWPAIAADRLSVTVETPADTIDVGADYDPAVGPFVRCFEHRDAAGDSLDVPGDVAVKSPDVEVPPEEDGTPTEDGPIDVFAQLADPTVDGPETELQDSAALIRGAGMVVKYYDLGRYVYGDNHFHGVALTGRARGWDGTVTASDEDIDDFLRAAEPPSHSNWEGTRNLTKQYGGSPPARVDDVIREIREAVKSLVQSSASGGEYVAGQLADRLAIGGDGPDGGPDSVSPFDHDLSIGYDTDDGRWTFDGLVRPRDEDHLGWEAEVEVIRIAPSGQKVDEIPITGSVCPAASAESTLSDEGAGDGRRVAANGDVDEVTLDGVTVADEGHGEAKVRINGRVAVQEDD